jgi:hypothetical protein
MTILNDISNEPVTQPGDRLHEARLLGVVPERLADFPNSSVDAVVRIEENVLTPDSLDDLIAGNKLLVVVKQEQEDLQRNAFELQRTPSTAQLKRSQVELEVFTELNDPLDPDWTGNQVALRIAVAVY